jgi:AsmA-like C-terminal region
MRRLEMDGLTGLNAPFSVRIASAQAPAQAAAGGKRTLTMTAANAGELLAGLDIVKRMVGGRLSVTGSYDDTAPDHPFDGTAEIEDFRIRDAPVLAHLLQAVTLYGLVEVVRGPGLGFSKMVAPFRLTEDTLTLTDARAFSPSLGLTARGTIDLELGRVALDGTIVPAYFFNSLLGNIPLVGRLFSPEQGGGLFAASYTVRGLLDDPTVTVNPLAALTPGFLRGVFGLF